MMNFTCLTMMDYPCPDNTLYNPSNKFILDYKASS